MTPIGVAAAQILARPAPVIVFDTCSLIDLFRSNRTRSRPVLDELQAAAELFQLVATNPSSVHLVVPELVPGEFSDSAANVMGTFAEWFRSHDDDQDWLSGAASQFGVARPLPVSIVPSGIATACRQLADDLLAAATVLARDQACLDRAVVRVVQKRQPSRDGRIKDAMNLEQSLDLSRRLGHAAYPYDRVFISSNTSDFAAAATSTNPHPDIADELAAAGLGYFTSIRAAVGRLRAAGQLP